MSEMAHFFVVISGSKIHERVAHFFIDIYNLSNFHSFLILKEILFFVYKICFLMYNDKNCF